MVNTVEASVSTPKIHRDRSRVVPERPVHDTLVPSGSCIPGPIPRPNLPQLVVVPITGALEAFRSS
ncbi:hypothetical protein GCM10027456_46450 [Kineosporia babensis]